MRVLHSAEFSFEKHKVLFFRARVRVYELRDGIWTLIGGLPNKWVNRGLENRASVMGREYKPRVTDAATVLNRVLKEQP